jgi:tRNA A64-2'-O-ribosylphosphate transferase
MASLYQPTSYSQFDHTNGIDYVQGAGDDNEMWSQGMSSEQWWRWRDVLLKAGDAELPELIARLLEQDREDVGARHDSTFTYISATQRILAIGGLSFDGNVFEAGTEGRTAVLIACCANEKELFRMVPEPLRTHLGKRILHLKCGIGKLGSRDLRKELPKLMPFIASCLTPSFDAEDNSTHNGTPPLGAPSSRVPPPRVTLKVHVADKIDGKDIATGVALALLALYSDDDGQIDWSLPRRQGMDKTSIRKKLSWITTDMPAANPSRATMNAVNEFLMR